MSWIDSHSWDLFKFSSFRFTGLVWYLFSYWYHSYHFSSTSLITLLKAKNLEMTDSNTEVLHLSRALRPKICNYCSFPLNICWWIGDRIVAVFIRFLGGVYTKPFIPWYFHCWWAGTNGSSDNSLKRGAFGVLRVKDFANFGHPLSGLWQKDEDLGVLNLFRGLALGVSSLVFDITQLS